ncbi:MAG: hypothetical protein DMG20_05585 [Acidobacteria bacterium]|nr:MAG: hypothetical protein DMG20_05585 [Acidobacteriota bacterium]
MAFVLIFIASPTTAQNGVRYPESFQITKNGTTVLLEDSNSLLISTSVKPSPISRTRARMAVLEPVSSTSWPTPTRATVALACRELYCRVSPL